MPKAKPPKVLPSAGEFYVEGDPPPPVSRIPRPPAAHPKTGPSLRGVKPRSSELILIGPAAKELREFDDYAKIFGTVAPSYDGLLAVLEREQRLAPDYASWPAALKAELAKLK